MANKAKKGNPPSSREAGRHSAKGKFPTSTAVFLVFLVFLAAGGYFLLRSLSGKGFVSCGTATAASCSGCGVGPDCAGDCRTSSRPAHKGECMLASTDFPYPPDLVPRKCQNVSSAELMDLKVSIIIPWLKEKWEHMEGTVRSLLHFTPDELVEEIIFISDGNEDHREAPLKALSGKVRVIALPERQGLIRAKMKGVEVATAPVIVFLEAHCIVNHNWLQPLLQRVKINPKVLAMPILDNIPQTDWHKMFPMLTGHWRYEWNFNLIFTNPGNIISSSSIEPYPSPGTSGGIFAMRRDWFQQLKLFDTGMYEWGGDHMELTMKVWRCGGHIEMVPCSRIGHLFRDPSHRPYNVEVNTVVYNYKRLAELWAKDHLSYFYKMKPEAVDMKLKGMDEVKRNYAELEAELQCKDLQWYLDNIDLEMKWEMDKICHPYAAPNDPIKCKGALVPGRWTITQAIPGSEYKRMRKALLKKNQTEEL